MGDIRADNQKTPLLDKQFPELPLSRTGNVWTAVAHIITGVIGSGVLSLSWSMAQLGWIAGPVAMLSFAITTLFSAFLLCNCYRSPDPETGPFRNRSYIEAVDMNLGKKKALACGLLLQLSLYGFGIAYTVTSGISMRAIQETNCYHKEGREATCVYGDSYYILLFGVAQIILSQIPNFHNIQWLSVVAAIMSFTYALVGLGLAAVKVIGTGYAQGSISGIPTPNAGQKVWLVSQALGDVAFSYPFSLILFEIQDTLEAPPSESETMKKASAISITITTFFYLFCGGFGYAAFGDATPGNLMTAFGSYELYWLVDLANVCIVLHLVGGYQDNVKRGQWTPEEDNKLSSYIAQHGTRNWRLIPKNAGLQRCGKSCRLRWTNYLRPDLKHGQFSDAEEQTIVKLHSIVGNRWSIIAAQLPGRTDNDVKNHWNTKLKKKLSGMGIDPVTHKPFSHLMAEIATTLEPPQVAHLAEAALGCFKDEMLHLLTKHRVDFQLQQSNAAIGNTAATYVNGKQEEHDDDTIEKIKLGLSRAIQEPDVLLPMNKLWDSAGPTFSNLSVNCSAFSFPVSGFQYEPLTFSNERDGSPWNQSMCTGSTCTVGDRQGRFPEKEENGEESRAGKEIRNEPIIFNSDNDLWDLPSDELMHPIV